MGTYCDNTRTDISLYLDKLQQGYLNRTPEFNLLMMMATNRVSLSEASFAECCQTLGALVKMDEQHNSVDITKMSGETKIGWQASYFKVLAPFARIGSFAEFSCRECGTWRYIKYGDKFIEQEGTVVVQYPPFPQQTPTVKVAAKLTTKRKSIVKAQNLKPNTKKVP